MIKNKNITLLVSCIMLLFGCRYDNVEIKCNYIMYACGDCYPRFNIDSIYISSNNLLKEGEDIYIYVKTKDTIIDLSDIPKECSRCYTYHVDGRIKYNLITRKKTMYVVNYELILAKGCCNTEVDSIITNKW